MRGRDEGYVAVDVMVALLIFAMTIILSLEAVRQSRGIADRAREVRSADSLLKHMMQNGDVSLTPAQGAADGFDWTLATEITGADRPIAICRKVVRLANRASGRKYEAASLVVCPSEVM